MEIDFTRINEGQQKVLCIDMLLVKTESFFSVFAG